MSAKTQHSTTGSSVISCPMHPEIRQDEPGSCRKCGMALEPVAQLPAKSQTEYVCPMHPEVVRTELGNCPICGMALERRTIEAEPEDRELKSMSLRFWVSAALALPVIVMPMIHELYPEAMQQVLSIRTLQWIELALATPVVLWGGWPFFHRGWASLVNRSLMFSLIGHYAVGLGRGLSPVEVVTEADSRCQIGCRFGGAVMCPYAFRPCVDSTAAFRGKLSSYPQTEGQVIGQGQSRPRKIGQSLK